MKFRVYTILAAILFSLCVFLLISSPLGRWIGKGEFITYEAADRSALRRGDRELIPSDATDITIWTFQFRGRWGGRFRIRKSSLEAWVEENRLTRYQDVVLLEMCYSKTNYRFIDTSRGPVYRTTQWHGAKSNVEYLLYYDDAGCVAYFNLSVDAP